MGRNQNQKPKARVDRVDNSQTSKNVNKTNSKSEGNMNNTELSPNATDVTEILGQTRGILFEQQQQQQQTFMGHEAQGVQHGHGAYMHTRTYEDFGQSQRQVTQSGIISQPSIMNNHQMYTATVLPGHHPTDPVLHTAGTNDIPNWALSLCQQMTNIQSTLETHTNRWHSVENHIAIQNDKLVNVQNQLAEITQIKQNIESTNRKVALVETEMKTVKTKVSEYDETIQQYSDMCDDITNENNEFDKRLKKIEEKIESLEKKDMETQSKIEKVDDRVTDVQWRSMRENLLFYGISESTNFQTDGENCEEQIQTIIKDELGIDKNIPMDRAHRLGRYRKGSLRPRPIVVKFTYYKDKELIKQEGQQKLRDSIYWVKDQYPREIEEKRKELYNVADEARKDPVNKVKLVRDKLFINGEQYVPKQKSLTDKQAYDNNTHRKRYVPAYGRRNGTSNNTDSANNRQYYNNQNSRNGGIQWSKTYYRRPQTSTEQTANTNTGGVSTNNRYSVLKSSTPVNSDNQPRVHARKKKATSPLEPGNTFKKQHTVNDSESGTDTDESTLLFDIGISESHTSTQVPDPVSSQDSTQAPVDDSFEVQTQAPVDNLPILNATPDIANADETVIEGGEKETEATLSGSYLA